jgi:hypothetical protein
LMRAKTPCRIGFSLFPPFLDGFLMRHKMLRRVTL